MRTDKQAPSSLVCGVHAWREGLCERVSVCCLLHVVTFANQAHNTVCLMLDAAGQCTWRIDYMARLCWKDGRLTTPRGSDGALARSLAFGPAHAAMCLLPTDFTLVTSSR